MKKFLTALLAGALAITAALSLTACGKDKKVKVVKAIELTSETYAFAIAKENTALKTAVDELLDELTNSGELNTIINSFFDGSATFEYTNPSSKEGCFIVATNAYFPPFEYYNGSKLSGVDMQIASLIAKKLGKTLYIDDMEFDSIISSVKTGKADIGMAGMTVTEKRLEEVNFSKGYYASAQVITVLEEDTTFDGCKTAKDIETILQGKDSKYAIGTQQGTTGYMYTKGDQDFGYDGFTNLTTKSYTTGALAMKDLQNGKINAVILDKQPSIMIADSLNK